MLRVNAIINKHFQYAAQFPAVQTERKPQVFSNNLKVGSIVYYKPEAVIDDYRKPGEKRPGLVYGLWRNRDGLIKKVEVMDFKTNLSISYMKDLLINTPQLKQQFHASKDRKLSTSTISIIDNLQSNFSERGCNPFQIDSSFWKDILVRRADALLHSRNLEIHTRKFSEPLIREGFTFEALKPANVRTGTWQPDVPDGKTQRIPSRLLPQATVDDVSRFAIAFYHSTDANGHYFSAFPPSKEWRSDLPHEGFPYWEGPKYNPQPKF